MLQLSFSFPLFQQLSSPVTWQKFKFAEKPHEYAANVKCKWKILNAKYANSLFRIGEQLETATVDFTAGDFLLHNVYWAYQVDELNYLMSCLSGHQWALIFSLRT